MAQPERATCRSCIAARPHEYLADEVYCKASPPTVALVDGSHVGVWPLISANEWCRQYQNWKPAPDAVKR